MKSKIQIYKIQNYKLKNLKILKNNLCEILNSIEKLSYSVNWEELNKLHIIRKKFESKIFNLEKIIDKTILNEKIKFLSPKISKWYEIHSFLKYNDCLAVWS